MTSREIRKQRREQERKAAKLAYRAARATSAPTASFEDEFSPEFIAEANAARERINARIAASRSARPSSVDVAAPEHPPLPPSPVESDIPAKPSRAEINRANSLHSTGPHTPRGKLASSRNALVHGLASGQLIIAGEDATAFESLLDALLAEHEPANTTEELLIHDMARSWWLTQRALRLQNECFTGKDTDEKRLALFLRYQTTHERAFHKALNTLIRLQKEAHRATGARCARCNTEAHRATGARCARCNTEAHRATGARCARCNTDPPKQDAGFVSQPRAATHAHSGFVSQHHSSIDHELGFVSQKYPSPPSELALVSPNITPENPTCNSARLKK